MGRHILQERQELYEEPDFIVKAQADLPARISLYAGLAYPEMDEWASYSWVSEWSSTDSKEKVGGKGRKVKEPLNMFQWDLDILIMFWMVSNSEVAGLVTQFIPGG